LYAGGGGGGKNTVAVLPDTAWGGGAGGTNVGPYFGKNAIANTGSGGGGSGLGGSSTVYAAGAGGSGIVVIRYPNYLAQAKSTTGSPLTYIDGTWRVYVFVASGTITF
jgi:hypothetical protein